MKKEKSAGAIVYRIEGGQPVYLLLHYPVSDSAASEYWDLPKGHIEQGETDQETALREVQEETGIRDIRFVQGFQEKIQYEFQVEEEEISKTVIFFLAETQSIQVEISHEHIGFAWLSYEKALQQLTYDNAKHILTKANNHIRGAGV